MYGKCANPNGHGHAYEVEVSIRGDVDSASGMLMPVGDLDALVRERLTSALDRKLLKYGLPPFEQEIPTAENIARYAWRALAGRVSPAVLHRIRLVETANNSVEYSEDCETE